MTALRLLTRSAHGSDRSIAEVGGQSNNSVDPDACQGARVSLLGCTICGLPVLELDGQFENLEPSYIRASRPRPREDGLLLRREVSMRARDAKYLPPVIAEVWRSL